MSNPWLSNLVQIILTTLPITTVALLNPEVIAVVGSDIAALVPDGAVSIETRTEQAQRGDAPSIRGGLAAYAPRGPSWESNFHPRRDSAPFPGASLRRDLMSDHRRAGVGQHRQGDMLLPALPAPHLVLIQPHLSLGLLKALLYGPPGPGRLRHFLQGSPRRAVAHVVSQPLWSGHAAPSQQLATSARLPQTPYFHGGPVVHSGSLGPVSSAAPGPAATLVLRRPAGLVHHQYPVSVPQVLYCVAPQVTMD